MATFWGGGPINSELGSRIDTFKMISRYKFHQPKRSIWVSLKYSVWFVPGFLFTNRQILMNWGNSPNSSVGPLIILLVFITTTSLSKTFGMKRKNYVR